VGGQPGDNVLDLLAAYHHENGGQIKRPAERAADRRHIQQLA
jgi:hypothetical protein